MSRWFPSAAALAASLLVSACSTALPRACAPAPALSEVAAAETPAVHVPRAARTAKRATRLDRRGPATGRARGADPRPVPRRSWFDLVAPPSGP